MIPNPAMTVDFEPLLVALARSRLPEGPKLVFEFTTRGSSALWAIARGNCTDQAVKGISDRHGGGHSRRRQFGKLKRATGCWRSHPLVLAGP